MIGINELTIGFLLFIFFLFKTIKILPAREIGIKERFGKFQKVLNPGFHFLIPFVDRIAYRHELREQVIDVPPQTCITKDNVQVEVDGVIFLKVMDAYKASYGIGNYYNAAVNLAQTTMRSEIGKMVLDDTFRERDHINDSIVREIDRASEPWGVKFIRYEIRNIDPTRNMIDTMERQMEAERLKRAQITLSEADRKSREISSEGEKIEAINLSEGEKQKRINEATGKSKQIELIATATANGIRKVAESINLKGGDIAMKMRITEQFVDEFGKVISSANVKVMPADLANLKGVLNGLSIGLPSHENDSLSQQRTKKEK